jgi:hypothetical protein
MIEVKGNLWTYPADVRVITTNGFIKKNGECVMGRGCALEAAKKWPELPQILGSKITDHGNRVHVLLGRAGPDNALLSFPVKHRWMEKADLELIRASAYQLEHIITEIEWGAPDQLVVVLPRPGCGNGGLKWEDVKPVLEPILDDRFHVITFGE